MALKKYFALIILIIISSCSSKLPINNTINVYKRFQDYSLEKPIKVFSREDLKDINYPLIEVRTNGVLKQTLMLPVSERENFVNYTSGSGQIITMNGAIISKTNGFNINLISVDLNIDSPLLFLKKPHEWPKESYRKYSYLTPLNSIKNFDFKCEFSIEKIEIVEIVEKKDNLYKLVENCFNSNYNFSNLYWADKSGFIWKSKQFLKKDIFADVYIINKNKPF